MTGKGMVGAALCVTRFFVASTIPVANCFLQ